MFGKDIIMKFMKKIIMNRDGSTKVPQINGFDCDLNCEMEYQWVEVLMIFHSEPDFPKLLSSLRNFRGTVQEIHPETQKNEISAFQNFRNY